MNRSVNLSKRVKTAKGMRFCPVVMAANGRVKPNAVLVNGEEEDHPEGAYYISWYAGAQLKRVSVGTDANAAAARVHRQEQILAARNVPGLTVVDDTAKGKGQLVVNAAADYLAEIEAHKKPKTYAGYRVAIGHFQESCSKQTLEEITREDLLAFIVFLRKKGFAPYTVNHTFSCALMFLKDRGVTGLGLKKNDWPSFTQDEPEAYEKEDLAKFFAACSDEERLWFNFFLKTGFREGEVQHCTWACVNFFQNTIGVQPNAEYGWTPKMYKARTVPVPKSLMDSLREKKSKAQKNCELVFPTGKCRPQRLFLEKCKLAAERAGLDPDTFWLHKFRSTFATWHLWAGVDLRTLQNWMGHTDLASTMRYLKPNHGVAMRQKVEATFA
jgi:integrase/recombinase XerD